MVGHENICMYRYPKVLAGFLEMPVKQEMVAVAGEDTLAIVAPVHHVHGQFGYEISGKPGHGSINALDAFRKTG